MWEDLKHEIIISLIMTVGSKVVLSIYRAIKSSVAPADQPPARYSSKTLKSQFYICSFIGLGAIFIAWASSDLIPFALPVGFLGFFLAWSAFEVAIEGNSQPQSLPDETTQDKTDASGENSK